MTLTSAAFVAAIVTVSRQNFTDIVSFFIHYILGHKSELLPILRGVPQGSIFGPLLFTICVNDMFNVSTEVYFIRRRHKYISFS